MQGGPHKLPADSVETLLCRYWKECGNPPSTQEPRQARRPWQVAMFNFVSLSHRYSCNVAHSRVCPCLIRYQAGSLQGRRSTMYPRGKGGGGLKLPPDSRNLEPPMGCVVVGSKAPRLQGSPPRSHPECRPRLQGVRGKCRPILAPNGGRTRAIASLLLRRRVP